MAQSSKLVAEQHFIRPRSSRQSNEPDAKKNLTTKSGAAASDHVLPKTDSPQPIDPAVKKEFAASGDAAVALAAFTEEGPQLTTRSQSQKELRSMVVDREEETDFFRSAQLPPSPDGDQPGAATPGNSPDQTGANSQFQEQLRLPFGAPPAQQPQTGPTSPGETQPGAAQPADEQLPPGEFPANTSTETAPAQGTQNGVAFPDAAKVDDEQKKSESACSESLAKLRAKTIGTVNLSITVSGTAGEDFPFECPLGADAWHPGRSWPQTTFLWKASALCHKPLYFEDEQLERYGHSFAPCCQPLVSGAHFFTRLPVLPYCMGVEPPLECIYALGYYRPGSCAPYMCEPIPISYRGALFQAGAVVGAAAALP